jgi:DNA-directed RNA polymerase specialized sigma24 family protein
MRAMKPAAESDSRGELTFDEFFLAEYDTLLRAMWLLTGNREDGEDLAQEAMARAFERWDKVQLATDPAA